jgi:hypothetical protein
LKAPARRQQVVELPRGSRATASTNSRPMLRRSIVGDTPSRRGDAVAKPSTPLATKAGQREEQQQQEPPTPPRSYSGGKGRTLLRQSRGGGYQTRPTGEIWIPASFLAAQGRPPATAQRETILPTRSTGAGSSPPPLPTGNAGGGGIRSGRPAFSALGYCSRGWRGRVNSSVLVFCFFLSSWSCRHQL